MDIDRYSLPRQVNRIMAILLALGAWVAYASISYSAAYPWKNFNREFCLGAVAIAAAISLSIWLTERLLVRFTIDRAPFIGTFVLVAIHAFFLVQAYLFHLGQMGRDSGIFAFLWGMALLFTIGGLWHLPLALIFIYWLIFSRINSYLGGRRDYF